MFAFRAVCKQMYCDFFHLLTCSKLSPRPLNVQFEFYLANLLQILWNCLAIAYQQIHKFRPLLEVVVVNDNRWCELFICILKIQILHFMIACILLGCYLRGNKIFIESLNSLWIRRHFYNCPALWTFGLRKHEMIPWERCSVQCVVHPWFRCLSTDHHHKWEHLPFSTKMTWVCFYHLNRKNSK